MIEPQWPLHDPDDDFTSSDERGLLASDDDLRGWSPGGRRIALYFGVWALCSETQQASGVPSESLDLFTYELDLINQLYYSADGTDRFRGMLRISRYALSSLLGWMDGVVKTPCCIEISVGSWDSLEAEDSETELQKTWLTEAIAAYQSVFRSSRMELSICFSAVWSPYRMSLSPGLIDIKLPMRSLAACKSAIEQAFRKLELEVA